jgi:hypothetical protein
MRRLQGSGAHRAESRFGEMSPHEPVAQKQTPHPCPLPFGRGEGESFAVLSPRGRFSVQIPKTLLTGKFFANTLLPRKRRTFSPRGFTLSHRVKEM